MFHFKLFSIDDKGSAMKIGTDGVLLGAWTDIEGIQRILDVGAGSGLIALMLAQRSKAAVDAVEADSIAVEQAIENFENSIWSDRLHIVNDSFQNFTSTVTIPYDLLVCNPPFFSRSLKSPDHLRTKSRHDDLLPASQLMEGATKIVSAYGKISIIIPCLCEHSWIKCASEWSFFISRKTYVYSTMNKQANRCLLEFSRTPSFVKETELTILDSEGHYTSEYRMQTKDFYLAF